MAVLNDAVGKTKGPYKAEFPKGAKVKIADRGFLEDFRETWKYHHKLEPRSIGIRGQNCRCEVGWLCHGGDELYERHVSQAEITGSKIR